MKNFESWFASLSPSSFFRINGSARLLPRPTRETGSFESPQAWAKRSAFSLPGAGIVFTCRIAPGPVDSYGVSRCACWLSRRKS
jgi:hypothetical protein